VACAAHGDCGYVPRISGSTTASAVHSLSEAWTKCIEILCGKDAGFIKAYSPEIAKGCAMQLRYFVARSDMICVTAMREKTQQKGQVCFYP